MRTPAWMADAACRGVDAELFYPVVGGSVSAAAAKATCAGCPAREACLAYALEHCELHGIWGGKSERERQKLRGRLPGQKRSREERQAS